MNFLTLSLCESAFLYAENSEESKEVWGRLKEEYEPSEDMDAYDLAVEFVLYKLNIEMENPSLWFMRLERINKRLKSIDDNFGKDDEDIKIHVKANLPEE